MLIFAEGGKPEDPEKNPRGKGENNTSNELKLTWVRARKSNPDHSGERPAAKPLGHMPPVNSDDYIEAKEDFHRHHRRCLNDNSGKEFLVLYFAAIKSSGVVGAVLCCDKEQWCCWCCTLLR
ncbi:hypothetical protein AC249_AIPGENE14626 [Exaiptasia diaphana]|nr:hypothetical protein AC249_AIPGENE14626 [Exaiptasia diaphana]